MFRKGVVIIVYDVAKKLFLSAQRSTINDAWQFPQGGIDQGKTPIEAAKQELEEEVGLQFDQLEYVAQTGPYAYHYPSHVKRKEQGQEQYWFLLYGNQNLKITLNYEFQSYKWSTKEEVLNQIVEFKKQCYISAFKDFERFF